MGDDVIRDTIPPDVIEARMTVHLGLCDEAVDALVDLHQRVSSAFAAHLYAKDRSTAIWELSGNALGLARAYLVLLRGGYVPAAGVMARALHEALSGLQAVADPVNNSVRENYFAERGIKAESARKSVQGTQRRAEAEGAAIDGDIRSMAGQIYTGLSAYAHNGRGAVREAVGTHGLFAYGPHPDASLRAAHVSYASTLIVQLVRQVSSNLSLFGGFTGADRSLGEPLIARLEGLDEQHPLGRPR